MLSLTDSLRALFSIFCAVADPVEAVMLGTLALRIAWQPLYCTSVNLQFAKLKHAYIPNVTVVYRAYDSIVSSPEGGVWWIWSVILVWLAQCARAASVVLKQTLDLIGQ